MHEHGPAKFKDDQVEGQVRGMTVMEEGKKKENRLKEKGNLDRERAEVGTCRGSGEKQNATGGSDFRRFPRPIRN